MPLGGHRERVPGPPALAGGLVLGAGEAHLRLHREVGDAVHRVPEDLGLEPALVRDHDVAELGAAHGRATRGVGAQHVRELPLVDAAELGGPQHLHDVAAPEAGPVLGLGQGHPDLLAGHGVAHEDDPPLVPGHAVAAVGHGPDLHLDGPPDPGDVCGRVDDCHVWLLSHRSALQVLP